MIKVDAGRRGSVGCGFLRRNLLVLFTLLLVVGTPSLSAHAEDEASPPAPRAPASAAYAKGTVWLLDLDPRDAKRWLGKREPSRAKPLQRLKPEAARWLLRTVEQSPRAGVALVNNTPDVGTPRSTWKHIESVSYIQDFDVEVGMGGARVADPIVGILQHGTTGSLGVTRAESGALAWSLTLTQAAVILPIPTFETTLRELDGQRVTIQLPELRVSRVSKELPQGAGWYLMGHGLSHSQKAGAPERRQIALVRVAELPAELPEGAAPVDSPEQFFVEAILLDHPATPLPNGYPGSGSEAQNLGAWFTSLRGGSEDEATDRAGVRSMPSILSLAGEEAAIEITDAKATTMSLKLEVDATPRLFAIGSAEPALGLTFSYRDTEHAKQTWTRRVDSKEVLIVPLSNPSGDPEKAAPGRYLALRVTRVPPASK